MPEVQRLTVKQYADRENVTERTVYNRIERGWLRIVQAARHAPITIILAEEKGKRRRKR